MVQIENIVSLSDKVTFNLDRTWPGPRITNLRLHTRHECHIFGVSQIMTYSTKKRSLRVPPTPEMLSDGC